MTTAYSKIQGALNKYLYEMAGLPDVIGFENKVITPIDGEIYLKVFCLPARPDYPFIGADTLTHEHGIFQVSVMAPAGDGWGGAYAMVDAIVSHFSRSASMTYGDGTTISIINVIGGAAIGAVGTADIDAIDITINVRRTWPSPGFPIDGRYAIPVNISYYGYM